ncbi:DNA (cytosine-5)-methyltransferase 3-like [Leptonychotes weddellii]|uniref:DNA (Cytosine-5)-methyltransferase 3-like n=1 Tax=Leptonychotes weddellii TaxID=9713 RepID=A0A7F8RQD1_LEPWE|nr:DNA (cytosine-5)-methyltransferase 3-like [Leptonychotes weddellii]
MGHGRGAWTWDPSRVEARSRELSRSYGFIKQDSPCGGGKSPRGAGFLGRLLCGGKQENPLETYKTVPVWKREPVRVLSLFGDIRRELESLGFLESGSTPGGLKHLDDVTDVVRRDVEGWGPFDLVYGSTPALGHACDHPPAWYLFQFHRVLQYARPRPGSQQPFFWMFVDNLVLSQDDQTVATRFLEVPVGQCWIAALTGQPCLCLPVTEMCPRLPYTAGSQVGVDVFHYARELSRSFH